MKNLLEKKNHTVAYHLCLYFFPMKLNMWVEVAKCVPSHAIHFSGIIDHAFLYWRTNQCRSSYYLKKIILRSNTVTDDNWYYTIWPADRHIHKWVFLKLLENTNTMSLQTVALLIPFTGTKCPQFCSSMMPLCTEQALRFTKVGVKDLKWKNRALTSTPLNSLGMNRNFDSTRAIFARNQCLISPMLLFTEWTNPHRHAPNLVENWWA